MFKVDKKLQTKVYVKPTNRQSFLYNKSEHPISTKKSIAFSQTTRFNTICYNKSGHHKNCKRIINTLTKNGYSKTDASIKINSAITIQKNKLLNKIEKTTTEGLPFTVADSKTLPNLKIKIDINWHVLV